MSEKLTSGLRGNFNRFLPDTGLVLEGGNISGTNLLDLQVNGTSKFNFTKAGVLNLTTIGFPGGSVINQYGAGVGISVNGTVQFGSLNVSIDGGGIINTGFYGWGPSNSYSGASTARLYSDSANTVAQRNGTANQTSRIYNTYTDGSNYERGVLDWATTSNVLSIGTQNAGTGTARNMQFLIGGVSKADYGITNGSNWTFSGYIFAQTFQATGFNIANVGGISGPSSGVFNFVNWGGSTFSRLNFGSALSTNPALKVSSTTLQIRLADDSDFAPLSALSFSSNSATALTASAPVLDLSQTWNNAAVTFTGIKLNVTSTASVTDSLLMDLQVGGSSQFNISKIGRVSAKYYVGSGGDFSSVLIGHPGAPTVLLGSGGATAVKVRSNGTFEWSNDTNSAGASTDTWLTRKAAANLQLGNADAASPVAQTLSVQSVVAGTSNTAGANWTFNGSQGTGTGAGGSLIFQAAPAGSAATGTAQNALQSYFVISPKINGGGAYSTNATYMFNFPSYGDAVVNFGAGGGQRGPVFACGGTPVMSLQGISGSDTQVVLNTGALFGFCSTTYVSTTSNPDTILSRKAAANFRLGATDAASPVAQTLSVQSVVAGTSNTAGANLTIQGSQSTGTAAGGSIIFQVAPAGTAANGTVQNDLATALTINPDKTISIGGSIANFIRGTNNYLEFANISQANFLFYGSGYSAGNDAAVIDPASSRFVVRSGGSFAWNSNAGYANGSPDTFLFRDAANTIAQRNGTANQTSRIYGTYTDASNYERLSLSANSTAAYIQSERAGTGTARPLYLGANNSTTVTIDTVGNVGIGTTSPDKRLTLYENSSLSSGIKVGAGPSNHYVILGQTTGSSAYNGNYIPFAYYYDNNRTIIYNYDSTSGSAHGNYFEYGTRSANVDDSLYPATLEFFPRGYKTTRPALFLSNNAFVGIGTRTPTSNLHVIGTGNITSNLVVQGVDVLGAIASANTYANSTFLKLSGGTINGDVSIVGNLALSGNTAFVNVSTYTVSDPLIYLASNNYSSDIVDIGWIANYVNVSGSNVHTGMFRDASSKEFYVFQEYNQEPVNNVIDPAGNNFTLAVLNTNIRTSNLILGGANAITLINSAFTKANSALANTSDVSFNGNLNFPTGNVSLGATSANNNALFVSTVFAPNKNGAEIISNANTNQTYVLRLNRIRDDSTGGASYNPDHTVLRIDSASNLNYAYGQELISAYKGGTKVFSVDNTGYLNTNTAYVNSTLKVRNTYADDSSSGGDNLLWISQAQDRLMGLRNQGWHSTYGANIVELGNSGNVFGVFNYRFKSSTTSGTLSFLGNSIGTMGIGTTVANSMLSVASTLTANLASTVEVNSTWNSAANTFTALKVSVANTNSSSTSMLADFQVDGSSKFRVGKDARIFIDNSAAVATLAPSGYVTINPAGSGAFRFASEYSAFNMQMGGGVTVLSASTGVLMVGGSLRINSNSYGTGPNVDLNVKATGNLQLGNFDAASPVAQTLSVQSVVAGTSNTAGANWTFTGSQGTGNGAGGSIIFQVSPAGSTGSTQNALATALTIASDKTTTLQSHLYLSSSSCGLIFPNAASFVLRANASDIAIVDGGSSIFTVSQRLGFGSTASYSSHDTYISRKAAASLQLGAADAASPVAQTLSVQSVVAGTANTAGANLTIQGSQSTGNGAGGSIIFQISPAGTGANTTQNALATALTIASDRSATFSGTVKTNTIISNSDFYLQMQQGAGIQHAGFWASGTAGALGGVNGAGFALGANYEFGWSGTNYDPVNAVDLKLARDAANILAQRRGTANQTSRIYGTYTDASNYERISISANSTAAYVQSENAGTGTARPLYLGANNSVNMIIDVNGNVAIGTTSTTAKFGVTTTSSAGFKVYPSYLTYQAMPSGTDYYWNNNGLALGSSVGTSYRLYVDSTGYFGGRLYLQSSIDFTTAGGEAAKISSPSFDVLRFSNSSGETLRIDTSGRVGIGITAPTARLAVANGTSTTATHIYGTYTDASNYERLAIIANSTAAYVQSENAGTGTARPLYLGSNNSTSITITPAGYVGISNTSPSAPLHVHSATPFTPIVKLTSSVFELTLDGMQINGSYGGANRYTIDSRGYSAVHTGMYFAGGTHAMGGDGVGSLVFATGNLSERMKITSAGAVGIATSSPSANLHVRGANYNTMIVDAAIYPLVNFASNTSTFGTIGSGNIVGATATDLGITTTSGNSIYISAGTTNQQVKVFNGGTLKATFGSTLDLDSTSTKPSIVFRNSANTFAGIGSAGTLFTGGNQNDFAISGSNVHISTTTSGTSGLLSSIRVTVDPSGNTGIGTTNPTSNLHVIGTANITSNLIVQGVNVIPTIISAYNQANTVGSSAAYDQANSAYAKANSALANTSGVSFNGNLNFPTGNVGIGTSAPAYKLEVNGAFAATTKSFVINHPTKPDRKLRYGSLEGPENGVYIRGRSKSRIIELPDYWTGLVHEDSITVNLTPIGKHQKLYVKSTENNTIIVGSDKLFGKDVDYYYTIFAERKDVEKLLVEI